MSRPNRVLIGAIDHALNRIDMDIRHTQDADFKNDLRANAKRWWTSAATSLTTVRRADYDRHL